MKLFKFLIILFLLNSCSFDNKTGIWKNENKISDDKQNKIFKDFKKISSSIKIFNENIPIRKKFKFEVDKPVQNISWQDYFFNSNNNLKNFKYDNLNQVVLKSKKLSKYDLNNYFLYKNNNVILNDLKGNLIVYSLSEKSIITKFNFYKKKYKKIKKLLNLLVDGDIIYVSDNIGYLYAYNYKIDQIIWAKNYKIPFRSNLKLFSNQLVTSNQNNDLFVFNKNSGDLKKLIPSEETPINNSFTNNIVLNQNHIIFLNTFGSLYSVNKNNFKFNWFINLNETLDLNISNLYFGSKVVCYKDKIFLSSKNNFYIIQSKNGSVVAKKNFSSNLRPIIYKNYIFLITKNNFLLSMNASNGKIIYSYDIKEKVNDFFDLSKKKLEIKNFMLVNGDIYIFLKNGYVVQLDIRGEINQIIRLPSTLESFPIIVERFLLYLNKKNKLILLN